MDGAVKIAAVGIIAAVCASAVKRDQQEIGLILSLTAAAVILGLGLEAVTAVLSLMEELSDGAGLSGEIIAPVVKTVGIAVLTRIASAFCKDAGEGGVATAVELGGAALALYLTLPLLRTVFSTLLELL